MLFKTNALLGILFHGFYPEKISIIMHPRDQISILLEMWAILSSYSVEYKYSMGIYYKISLYLIKESI